MNTTSDGFDITPLLDEVVSHFPDIKRRLAGRPWSVIRCGIERASQHLGMFGWFVDVETTIGTVGMVIEKHHSEFPGKLSGQDLEWVMDKIPGRLADALGRD